MIKSYELTADRKLSESEHGEALLVALAPSREEMGRLAKRYDFPFDYLSGILDDDENARFEVDKNGTLLLLLQYPALSDITEVETYPYSLIVTAGGTLIYALNQDEKLGKFLSGTYEIKRLQHQLLYRIVGEMTDAFHTYLTDFRRTRHQVARAIKKSTENDQLLALISIQSSLVYFEEALNNNSQVLVQLKEYMDQHGENGVADRIYDLLVENNQAATDSKIQGKLIENLRDLFSNIVANNLNIVMKIMTSATFVLGIPAVIFGFYGVNVPIPGQQSTAAVWLIIGVTLVVSGLVSWLLRKKDFM